jgi:hypothetical protein
MPRAPTEPRRALALGVLLLALALAACARDAPRMEEGAAPATEVADVDRLTDVEQEPRAHSHEVGEAPSPAPTAAVPAEQPATGPTPRRVHYDGSLRLRATSPRDTIDAAGEIATTAGGYVEDLRGNRVVLRVPVERFEEVFDRLETLGDVLSRAITAEDVTEAYTAVELRLRAARAARDRLRRLLAGAANEKQKLGLLREIQRLTVEIDQIEAQLRHLESLAAYSRITLEVEARQALAAHAAEDVEAMRWIGRLSPFERQVAAKGDRLELAVPAGMVRLDPRRRFVAESADGAILWASERHNQPAGSTEFWIEALESRLAPGFASSEIVDAGEFRVLRLVDRSPRAYRYLVAVRAAADRLQVVEAYFPEPAHEERYGEAVLASIAGGEV